MTRATMKGQYAGFASRFVAFAIDLALVLVTAGVINWVMIATLGLVGIDLRTPLSEGSNWFQTVVFIGAVFLLVLMPFLLLTAYWLLFWTTTGQTIGKRIVGVRVVRFDGERMRAGNAVRRIVMYFVSMLPLFLGFIWILIDDERRGWHDKVAGTCVIYAWEAREMTAFMEATQRRASHLTERVGHPPSAPDGAPETVAVERVQPEIDSAETTPPLSGA